MILDSVEATLKLLVQAEEGAPEPAADGARYAPFAISYGKEGGPRVALSRLGECRSLIEAVDRLAFGVARRWGVAGEGAEARIAKQLDLTADEPDFERWLHASRAWVIPYLKRLASPERRFFAYWLLGWVSGPFEVLTANFEKGAYIGGLGASYPAARYVFGLEALPPHQDEAACILELPAKRRLGKHDKALLAAAAEGDLAAVEAALRAGAAVNARDSKGNGPLHHAAAHRRRAVVERLLAAGADPDLGAEEHDAPLFAGLDAKGRVGPYARRIEGEEHFALLRLLVDAGARVDTTGPDGQSIVDLAAPVLPYPEAWVSFFLARGAVPKGMSSPRPLHTCLGQLRWRYERDPWVLVNEVRLLLESGADPNLQNPHSFPKDYTPLHELLDLGYAERELDVGVLVALADLLLTHGANPLLRDAQGRTPLDRAESWAQGHPHYQRVVERLRGSGAT